MEGNRVHAADLLRDIRGAAEARERTGRIFVAFQAEGIAAALADLGRHEEALEALGASDTLAGNLARKAYRL